MLKKWHEKRELKRLETSSSGYIYIEFGPAGEVRTFNNESDKRISVDDDGTIRITDKKSDPS